MSGASSSWPHAHPLDGVFEKLRRAQAHTDELGSRIDTLIQEGRQRYVFDAEPKSTEYALRVHGLPRVPAGWQTIVGDALFNVRSSLDDLAWQLVLLDGGTPSHHTQFPIHENPLDSQGRRRQLLQPAVSDPAIVRALETVQPYNTPNGPAGPRSSILWMLNRLNVIDKHRLLVVLVALSGLDNMWWGWEGRWGKEPAFRANVADLEDGSPVAWFDFHGRRPPDDFDPHPAIQGSLDEVETPTLRHIGVVRALDAVRKHVQYDVVEAHFLPLFG